MTVDVDSIYAIASYYDHSYSPIASGANILYSTETNHNNAYYCRLTIFKATSTSLVLNSGVSPMVISKIIDN